MRNARHHIAAMLLAVAAGNPGVPAMAAERPIAAVQRTLDAFKRDRSAETGQDLINAVDAVPRADRSRFDARQRGTMREAETLVEIVRAPDLARAQRATLPLFVEASEGDDARLLRDQVRRGLLDPGLRARAGATGLPRLVASLDEAAVIVSLRELRTEVRHGRLGVTVEVSAWAELAWGADHSLAAQYPAAALATLQVEGDARRQALGELALRIAEKIMDDFL
ncbi:hypothetical protein STVA_09150 [Allostella vacuolata]|nr:hypothetical protein STVA_09150 [Stella vacuolata]